MIKRTKMIVYTDNLRNLRALRPIAHLQYYSKIFHYAIFYVNESDALRIKERLEKSRKITKVEIAPYLGGFEGISQADSC
ncbi:DUF2129 domain-containing protein [Xylocopilactobacillus apicola]|uniref:DUF2129 domain-containing protein n=1 Tax=Xylocopilactobacillus apicola TaxID=2932184 RepID=A0AAU9DYV6_9LACO|nr:DUF2129 domain-containing protein [Xylocopilactobacillus apicola]BDR59388.1 hypothetical protein XA3_18290 [Xylocopilactobacillus apicola]